MPIFHFSISESKSKPFFEYSQNNHNLHSLLRKLVKKQLFGKNEIKSFKDDQFIITIKAFNSMIFSCITTPEYPVEKTILFIGEIENYYTENKNYEVLKDFTKEKMQFYNSVEFLTKNEQIIKNLKETKEIVFDDLSKILERENKINEICAKTERMAQEGFKEGKSFKQQLIQKKKIEEENEKIQIFYKKRKGFIILASILIALIVIFFLLTYICGDFEFSECS